MSLHLTYPASADTVTSLVVTDAAGARGTAESKAKEDGSKYVQVMQEDGAKPLQSDDLRPTCLFATDHQLRQACQKLQILSQASFAPACAMVAYLT